MFRTACALLLLLLVFGVAAAAGPEAWDKELDGPVLLSTNEDTILVARIIDYWTGLPVSNAEVKLFQEVLHPTPGFGTPIATGRAGEDGWVRIPRGDLEDESPGDWAYFLAPERGPDSRFQAFHGEIVELKETCDVPLLFVDPLDRPVADLGVGLLLGCGHTPDVRIEQTDAEGRVVIPEVQTAGFKQVWIWKPGILSHYGPWEAWAPGDPPLVHRCERALVVKGRVLTHDGKPAPGVAVGTRNYHRGPWGYSNANGEFRVLGTDSEPGDELYVEPFEGRVGVTEWHTSLYFVVPPPGIQRIFRLPPPGEEAEEEPAEARLQVRVTVDGAPPEDVIANVVVARTTDGWTEAYALEEAGPITLELPKGPYRVVAWLGGITRWPGLGQAATDVDLAAGAEAEVTLSLPAPRRLRIATHDWAEDGSLHVVTERLDYYVGDHRNARETDVLTVPIPPEGAVHLRLEQDPLSRLVPVAAAAFAPNAEPLSLPWTRPTRIRARLVDESGAGVDGWLAVQRQPPDTYGYLSGRNPRSRVEASVLPESGLWAWAWAPAHERRPVRLPLPSPLPAGESVDLGDVRLLPRAEPRLVVLRPNGEPEGTVDVRISTAMARFAAESEAGAVYEPWGEEAALAEGATVLVLADPLSWRAVLAGPPPWRLAPPPGRLLVRAFTKEGKPHPRFHVLVDGEPVKDVEGQVDLSGLEVGAHDVVVTSPGSHAWHYRVVLDGETRGEITCTLRPLPEPEDEDEE